MAVAPETEAEDFWLSCLRTRLVETDGVSAFSSYEATTTAHDKLSIELKAIRRALSLAIARNNDISITARLPPEVLSYVFSCLSECDPPSSRPLLGDKRFKKTQKMYLGWITTTHVCRRWRQLALSMPQLWSKIGAPHTAFWMDEMLIRSKQLPFIFSACVEHNDDGVHDIIIKALGRDYVRRMKGLHIAYEPRRGVDYRQEFERRMGDVQSALSFHTPFLESLAFSGENILNNVLETVFGSNWRVIRHIAYRHLPELPSIDMPHLQNIVDLEICLNTRSTTVTPSLAELSVLLGKLPMLETLAIKDERHQCTVPLFVIGRAPLHSLKSLYLETRCESYQHRNDIVEFLSHLDIAPTACREIKLSGVVDKYLSQVIPIATMFGDTDNPSTCLSPCAIDFSCCDSDGPNSRLFSVRAWAADDPPSRHRFGMHWTTSLLSPRGPVTQLLFSSFDLQAVTRVVFDSESFDEDVYGAVKHAFTEMPAVRTITLGGHCIGPVLCLLQEDVMFLESIISEADLGSDAEPISLCFPNSLTVSKAKFGDITLDHEDNETALGDLLLVVIQKQAALNIPLHTLSISHCEGAELLLARLRPHVKDLHYEE